MRGLLSHAGYLPYRRLDRSTIAAVAGGGGGKGTRTVASYDEDTTTMGVEAARLALRSARQTQEPTALYFSTTAPVYADKANATAIHAALRLPPEVIAADAAGSARSAVATLRTALVAQEPALVVAADIRTGLPGSPDESAGSDGASAIVVGDERDGPLLAEYLGSGSVTEEFLDRWRTPGQSASKVWEERFGEQKYVALGEQAWIAALKRTGLTPDEVSLVIVAGSHTRAVGGLAKRLGRPVAPDLAGVGYTGAAHPGLVLSSVLETAEDTGPGRIIALVSLADGADVLLFRTTEATRGYVPARSIQSQIDGGAAVPYGKFLAWRGMLTVEPPRRPEPARVSASAAGRRTDWKFGFVGSRATKTGEITMPPSAVGEGEPVAMADARGTVVTFTVDRLAYSPSPPVVFAVVDFDGGGRLPVELTDVDAEGERAVAIGDRVEMTFRRLSSADGIHNYFWKARPVR